MIILIILSFCLACFAFLVAFFLIRKGKKQKLLPDEIEKIPCPHRYFDNYKEKEFNRGLDAYRFLDEWECDYCGEVVGQSKDYPGNFISFYNEISLPPLIEKHLVECEKARKAISEIENKKNRRLTYDDETSLKEKGYQSWIIRQVKSWELINRINLPNLKEKKG